MPFSFVLFLGAAFAETPAEVPDPRSVSVWISDTARMVDEETERHLNRVMERIHDQLASEFLVVTVTSAAPEGDAFAELLLERWKLDVPGQRVAVLVMVAEPPSIRVAVSPAWQGVFDTSWQEGANARLLRAMESQTVSVELEAMVSEAEGRVRRSQLGAPPPEEEQFEIGSVPPVTPAPPQRSWLPFAGAGGVLVLGGAVGAFAWSRRRRCPRCAVRMETAPADPPVENLGYRVDACGACGYARLVETHAEACPECKTPKMNRAFRLAREPEDGSPGEVEITESCSSCGFERSTSHATAASAAHRAD